MTYSIDGFIEKLSNDPSSIEFNNVVELIDTHYDFTETSFSNGSQQNSAGQNSGSCKVLSFAQLHNLSKQQTLNLFAQYYRDDVLANPDGDDHQNIRQFIKHGFEGLSFDRQALTKK